MRDLIKKCPECKGIHLILNREKGEIICKDCGLVVEEKIIDFGQEWREFDYEQAEKRRRAGTPLNPIKFDLGLGTDVGLKSDIFKLKKGRNKFFRLRKWQSRTSNAVERNLKYALAELRRISSYLKLPKSVEKEAAEIYTQIAYKDLIKGRAIEIMVAGAIYAACKRHEIPRTLNELSEPSNYEKKEIARIYRFITRSLSIKIMPSNPVDYIPRFASALKLNAETQSKAVEILEKAMKNQLICGKAPISIAAASLYIASLMNGEKKTQREFADRVGVTEVTIRNRYKEMIKELNLKSKIELSREENES